MSLIAEVLVLIERWSLRRDSDALIEAHRLLGLLVARVREGS